MLVPELDVVDLARSLRFYVGVLGFRVLFERPAERFAYLERDGAELMVQEAAGPGRRFRTAPAAPIMPVVNRRSVAGSGTALSWPRISPPGNWNKHYLRRRMR